MENIPVGPRLRHLSGASASSSPPRVATVTESPLSNVFNATPVNDDNLMQQHFDAAAAAVGRPTHDPYGTPTRTFMTGLPTTDPNEVQSALLVD